MKKFFTSSAAALLLMGSTFGTAMADVVPVTPNEPEESAAYPIAFPADSDHGRTDRTLSTIGLSFMGSNLGTLEVGNTVAYHFITTPIRVKAGQNLTPVSDYSGAWMHTYWYIDYNQDGEFNTETNADGSGTGELVSFNFWGEDEENGANSLGETTAKNIQVNTQFPFTLPEDLAPGIYRMRMKIDWNDKDHPEGRSADNVDGNFTLSNGGYVIDFLIQVTTDMVAVNANLPEGVAGLQTIAGDVISAEAKDFEPENDIVISGKSVDGGFVKKLIARIGYNFDSEFYKVNGNPVWAEYEITPGEEGNFTIPADYVTAPILLIPTVDKSSAVEGISANTGVETYYNLLGVKVANPTKGIFVTSKGQKVVIK